MKHFVYSLVFVALLFVPNYAGARNADILLTPTRIILEGGNRFATVNIRNNGDGVGRYNIGLVDTLMNEDGGIKVRDDGSRDQFSALDMLSISPRNLTLKPDEDQTVRILVKAKNDLPDGEYRSHLQVKITETDLDLATGKPANDGASVSLKPLLRTVIPVIIRKGSTNYDVKIEDAQLVIGGGEGKQVPEVKVMFSFSGNRSVLGDLKVTHISPEGKETQLVFFRGIAIYRGVERRAQIVSLNVPDGVNIRQGMLRVAYMSQENEGSHVLATKDLKP